MPTQEMVTRTAPQTAASSNAAPVARKSATLLPVLATSALLWLSFFPMAWGWLGWIALVPLLTLVRASGSTWKIYLSAWVGGLAFYWPVLQWMRVADERMYFTWGALATYCSCSFPLAIYLIRLLDRRTRLPFIVSVPIVWTSLEFVRSFAMTGFPWYLLAHTQHDYLNLIQIADITGAWGISFLVASVNALLCLVYLALRGRPGISRSGLAFGAIWLALALVATFAYGLRRTDQNTFEPGPTVALVQGNLPQELRNNPTTLESILAHYIGLCDIAGRAKPALIVTPETSLPFRWEESWPAGITEETRDLCRDVSRQFKAPVLIGLNSEVRGSDKVARRYNSAALVNEKGQAVARYDKIHRVPFGEYVPLRDWFPWMNRFAPYDFDYSVSPGAGATRFPLGPEDSEHPPARFGVVICYEDTDPDTARPLGGSDGQPPADFVVNISNDGWFEGTSEHEQHLAICRFRAIECRRPVVRAVNMGISGMIDSNGRVIAPRQVGEQKVPSGVDSHPCVATVWEAGPHDESLPLARWGEFKKNATVILATIPLDTRSSFYVQFGDWLPWLCCAIGGGALILSRRRKDETAGYRTLATAP
jgi:apolipoprotein N-acyltransferase